MNAFLYDTAREPLEGGRQIQLEFVPAVGDWMRTRDGLRQVQCRTWLVVGNGTVPTVEIELGHKAR